MDGETNGTVKALYRLRDQKMVRFIGVTSRRPATLAKALDRYDFDATQMALNAGLQGRSPDGGGYWKKGGADDLFGEALPPKPHPGTSFEEVALPVAVRKKLGIVAMKVTAQEGLLGTGSGKADAAQLIRYALSLPVSGSHRRNAEARFHSREYAAGAQLRSRCRNRNAKPFRDAWRTRIRWRSITTSITSTPTRDAADFGAVARLVRQCVSASEVEPVAVLASTEGPTVDRDGKCVFYVRWNHRRPHSQVDRWTAPRDTAGLAGTAGPCRGVSHVWSVGPDL